MVIDFLLYIKSLYEAMVIDFLMSRAVKTGNTTQPGSAHDGLAI